MKKTAMFAVVAAMVLFGASAVQAQDWTGMARVQGTVFDQNGKPVEGAKVILRSVDAGGGPEPILTDKKGRWAAMGLNGGQWNIDVEKEGFLTRQLSASLSEINRAVPPMKITLEPAPPPVAPEPQREVVQIGGVEVSPEIVSAIEAANAAMKEEKWKDAAAGFEKAMAVLPDNNSIRFALARAYYGAGELKKAIELMQAVYKGDTGNVTAATLLANMLIEDGQIEAGKGVLDGMPEGSILDPNVLLNVGILFINKNLPADAFGYFDRAVGLDAGLPVSYYYRALASLQLRKMDAAKADLKKVIEMAPDSSEASDAKDLLAQIK